MIYSSWLPTPTPALSISGFSYRGLVAGNGLPSAGSSPLPAPSSPTTAALSRPCPLASHGDYLSTRSGVFCLTLGLDVGLLRAATPMRALAIRPTRIPLLTVLRTRLTLTTPPRLGAHLLTCRLLLLRGLLLRRSAPARRLLALWPADPAGSSPLWQRVLPRTAPPAALHRTALAFAGGLDARRHSCTLGSLPQAQRVQAPPARRSLGMGLGMRLKILATVSPPASPIWGPPHLPPRRTTQPWGSSLTSTHSWRASLPRWVHPSTLSPRPRLASRVWVPAWGGTYTHQRRTALTASCRPLRR